jgi:hypothetical protein
MLMTIELHISRLDDHCRGRASGFREAVIAMARREGDNLTFTAAEWSALSRKYSLYHRRNRTGLGDRIERAVKPVARALRLKCLDEAGNLKPDSGCAKRRDAFNRRFPNA